MKILGIIYLMIAVTLFIWMMRTFRDEGIKGLWIVVLASVIVWPLFLTSIWKSRA